MVYIYHITIVSARARDDRREPGRRRPCSTDRCQKRKKKIKKKIYIYIYILDPDLDIGRN